jgi:hypothetical protein
MSKVFVPPKPYLILSLSKDATPQKQDAVSIDGGVPPATVD